MDDDLISKFSLEGRSTVVTGAASGIGREIALTFARAGADVVAIDRDGAGAEVTAEDVRTIGTRAESEAVDVADRAQVDLAVQRAVDVFGRLDVMANVAGIPADGPIVDIDASDFDRLLAINLKGTLWGCQAAVGRMRASGGGSIINVSSGSIDTPAPGFGAYAMTKAAVAMLTKTLATEVGRDGIRVNTLVPGATLTGFTSRRLVDEDGNIVPERVDAFTQQMARQSPLRRISEVGDQALMALFLASDASGYCTGQLWRPNGGQAMPW